MLWILFFYLLQLHFTINLKIISAIAELFDIKAQVPTSFEGIPTVNNQMATFYWFLPDRDKDDINNLWKLFEAALFYDKKSLNKYFDLCINCKGNASGKISMGLYWIDPDKYLNLDKNNTWYIYKSGKIPEDIVKTLPVIKHRIKAFDYFDIINKLQAYLHSDRSPINSFKELSYEAWRCSNQKNQEEKEQSQQEDALADEETNVVHYWLYAPGKNADHWDEFYQDGIMAIGWDELGDLSQFHSKSEIREQLQKVYDPNKTYRNDAYAIWQFTNEINIGDIVFAKRGLHEIIGYGVVSSEYQFDESRTDYNHVRQVNWLQKGNWPYPTKQSPLKTLTDMTQYIDVVEKLKSLFQEDEDGLSEEPAVTYSPYGPEDFLEDVYMTPDDYETLVGLLKRKKNVILQGAPGVGKTYAAKRLAYSMMGVKDKERVTMVQFHQSYSYEDFIMGYRPTENGFELKTGVFYDFCKKAEEDSDNDYFFIIDEINRGNLSKIFGELFMLIENDKRGIEMRLLYANEQFAIPKNVYLIGMMNTADRSLAMLDYALRRRFAFFEMKPGFDTEGFKTYQQSLESPKFDRLIDCVKQLNDEIAEDETLGDGFCIGHSYFCQLTTVTDEILKQIVNYELIPLLKEYWFDEPEKVQHWKKTLRSAIA